jgi:hypothetical protein
VGAEAVKILEQTANLLSGPRADSYGDFSVQMTAIADAFNALVGSPNLAPTDIALILLLLKMKRLETGWDRDSAVDICGYGALIGEHFTADE